MSNYKIRVNSEAESKEAQELFLKYGATGNMCLDQSIRYVCTFNGALTQYDFLPSIEFKRITLPQLRDMVVLKRNKVGDATHTDGRYSFYVGKDKNYFFSSCDKAWRFSTVIVADLKPIEKKEMKEYLDPENNYRFNVTDKPFFDWIEIPEGANFAWKSDGKYVFFTALEMGYRDASVVWSRHTLPEELPFIDDECYTNKSDGVFSLPKSEPCDISNWVEIREEGSLNDQYAEIETVRQSAWQKQEGGSHYKNLKIQPMQYALENKLDYAQANVVKYVTRHKEKNGKEDLLKAIHNIELMIEFYYGDEK